MKRNSRRRTNVWLAGAAAVGLGSLSGTTALQAAPFTAPAEIPLLVPASMSTYAFAYDGVVGTSMELLVQAPRSAEATECQRQVLAEIERLRGILSTYDPSSEISQVMAGASIRSPELHQVLDAYQFWNAQTNGAIDVRCAQSAIFVEHRCPG